MKQLFIISSLFLFCFHHATSQESYLLVGTYTGGKSEGIYVYKFNSEDASYKQVSHVKTSNPSFLTISPDEKYVYAVQENGRNGNGGEVSAFSFDKEKGVLTLINTQATHGDHPCYVEIDKTGKWVFAGNYSSGNLSVFPVSEDGSIGVASTQITHSGSGPDKSRQANPHVHCTMISPDNKWLLVPDLGIDKVMIYSFDASSGRLSTGVQAFAKSQPGAGPRHVSFHPNGKYVYLDIAMFKLDKKGKASIMGFQSAGGKSPRNFNFDPTGNYLLVGNQDSDEIAIFQRNKTTGLLTDTKKRIEVGKPVCIKWISTK